jgi:hypothetical protein
MHPTKARLIKVLRSPARRVQAVVARRAVVRLLLHWRGDKRGRKLRHRVRAAKQSQ